MESFKHGCPVCKQHIEYTVEYCGKQIKCPSCGNLVTFPALPPSRIAKSSALSRIQQRQAALSAAKKAGGGLKTVVVFLRDYPHWKLIGQCLVPFVAIGVLLYGAKIVRARFSDQPEATTTVVQADPNGWQHMKDLTHAEVAVKAWLSSAQNAALQVRHWEAEARKSYPPAEMQKVNANLTAAHQSLGYSQNQFQSAYEKYRQLGGTVDYQSRLPQ